jgi:hypothetical protein
MNEPKDVTLARDLSDAVMSLLLAYGDGPLFALLVLRATAARVEATGIASGNADPARLRDIIDLGRRLGMALAEEDIRSAPPIVPHGGEA